MYSLVFSPTLVSEESTVKIIFHLNGRALIRPHIGSLNFSFPVMLNHICDESIRSGRHFDTKYNSFLLSLSGLGSSTKCYLWHCSSRCLSGACVAEWATVQYGSTALCSRFNSVYNPPFKCATLLPESAQSNLNWYASGVYLRLPKGIFIQK
jgi:hypothetical protein